MKIVITEDKNTLLVEIVGTELRLQYLDEPINNNLYTFGDKADVYSYDGQSWLAHKAGSNYSPDAWNIPPKPDDKPYLSEYGNRIKSISVTSPMK